jgi:hypothetical protein
VVTRRKAKKIKIAGSGGGARNSVLYVGGLPGACFALGIEQGYYGFLPLLLAIFAVAVRSAFMGVFLVEDELVVVSWFKTWRFERESVRKVVWRKYSGFFNRFQDDDSRLTWIWMIGLRVEGRQRTYFFPSTIGLRTRVERVASAIAANLDVRAVRTSEISE